MTTECYAIVRGSTLRVTSLTPKGHIPADVPVRYVVSKSVVKVTIDEVIDSSSGEVQRNTYDKPVIETTGRDDFIGYGVSIDFLRTDPGLLHLMTSAPLVEDADGDIIGIDSDTRLPVAAFGLEVWSKLMGRRRWGYTLLPFLKGGYLSGFEFSNSGRVSFNLRGATTQNGTDWCAGPYDFHGMFERLVEPVSRNDALTTTIMDQAPPEQTDGIVSFNDCISNGDAADPDPLAAGILAGGSASMTSPWTIHGGRA